MSNKYTDAIFLRDRRLAFAMALSAVLLLAACHQVPPPSPAPAPVVALPVHAQGGGTVAGDLHYPIEVAARYTTVMAFRVAGQIIERKVRLGDVVHRGEVIAHLDPIDAEKQLAGARAALDAAEHRL